MDTSPCLLLVDAQGSLGHISPTNSPAATQDASLLCFPALPALLLGISVWEDNSEASPIPAQGTVTVRCLKPFHSAICLLVSLAPCLLSCLGTQAAESALFYNEQKGLQVQGCARLSLLHCSLPVGDFFLLPIISLSQGLAVAGLRQKVLQPLPLLKHREKNNPFLSSGS